VLKVSSTSSSSAPPRGSGVAFPAVRDPLIFVHVEYILERYRLLVLLATSAKVVSRAPSPAQIRGPCRPARILPQGDGIVQARATGWHPAISAGTWMSPGRHPALSAGARVCCSACCAVAGVVRSDLGGGLGVSACARGAYLGAVLPSSPFGASLVWLSPKGWCRGAR